MTVLVRPFWLSFAAEYYQITKRFLSHYFGYFMPLYSKKLWGQMSTPSPWTPVKIESVIRMVALSLGHGKMAFRMKVFFPFFCSFFILKKKKQKILNTSTEYIHILCFNILPETYLIFLNHFKVICNTIKYYV